MELELNNVSPVMQSCLYTMGIASKIDHRQHVPPSAYIPDQATRLLRARLILEEALETVQALGFEIGRKGYSDCIEDIDALYFRSIATCDVEAVIDGCCDTIYVATGTLVSFGVADLPHLDVVCLANDLKFPNGVATCDANGKYIKPPGWTAPDHSKVNTAHINLAALAYVLQESVKHKVDMTIELK